MKKSEDILKTVIAFILLFIAIAFTKVMFTEMPYWACFLIYLPAYLTAGYEVILKSVKNIAKGEIFDENFLMSIATIGAVIMGDFAEAVFVMLFFKVGEIFEEFAEEKSERSIAALLAIRPDKATVIESGKEIEKPVKDVAVGDTIIVKPGERIPLDGTIIEGQTEVDTSAVTGESALKFFGLTDTVYSGTVNMISPVKIRVTATEEKSTASKIIELVKNARDKKAKTERFITKFAKIYTPVVVGLSLIIAFVVPIFAGDFKSHIYSALTFLVVSCPCALVISVPISFFGAIGCASKNGVLVKGSDALEQIAGLDTVVFDKTGTLTKGVFEVSGVHSKTIGEKEILKLAAAVEAYSSHPIAKSIVSSCTEPAELFAQDLKNIAGKGIEARIEGKRVLVGNEKLMADNGIEYKECSHGGTVVHVAIENKYLGHIVIADSIKEETKDTVMKMKLSGIESVMLTGDNQKTASQIAQSSGIEKYGHSLLPENKVDEIKKIKAQGKTVAFAGDGINDAPALAASDVGIAMGALGSDAAIETADIVIMDDDIKKIPLLIRIAKKAKLIAKENIIFSVAVKVAVLLLSAFAIPNIMWFAAFADVGVLVLAVLNSMRTMKIDRR